MFGCTWHVSHGASSCQNLPSKFQCRDKHWFAAASQNQRSMASTSEMIRPFEPVKQKLCINKTRYTNEVLEIVSKYFSFVWRQKAQWSLRVIKICCWTIGGQTAWNLILRKPWNEALWILGGYWETGDPSVQIRAKRNFSISWGAIIPTCSLLIYGRCRKLHKCDKRSNI